MVAVVRVFGDEEAEGGAGLDAERARGVEKGEGVGVFVAHDSEGAFVFGVKGDFGVGDGFSVVVGDFSGDGNWLAGAGVVIFRYEGDGEAGSGRVDVDFAVADAELRFLVFAAVVL